MLLDIDIKISEIKIVLASIFDRYKDNNYFENIEPSNIKVLIYGNTIKFIPIELNEEVQELLNILASLEETKYELTTKKLRIK